MDLRAHIEAISPLTDAEWEFVSRHFTSRKFRKHQYLVQQGDPVPYDFWVAAGMVKAYVLDENGKEHILQFAMEDWWCTDYNAYQTQTKASIFIDCLENCEVLCLALKDREKICKKVQAMERFFRIKSNLGYIALQKRIISLLQDPAETRFRKLLKQYPRLAQRVPKKHLAAYLGVTRETLSRQKA
ncbi:MAG: Crp/Fnr family transcriptional regulator [Fibrobacteria bacterium]